MTEKKEAKQQQTKERIVEAALEEFCRVGFSRHEQKNIISAFFR